MKGMNIIKDFPYNYDRIIIQSFVKESQQERKKIFTLKVFEMMPHGTLNFQIAF
jgi:hypothetical protein